MLFLVMVISVLTLLIILAIFLFRKRESMHPTYLIRNVDGVSYATECKADQTLQECEKEIEYHVQEPEFNEVPMIESRPKKPALDSVVRPKNYTVSNRYQAGFTRNIDGMAMASRCISS
jgi:hypothetical protein